MCLSRVLPITAALALLPALAAAPIPPQADRPTFRATGVLDKADLDRVWFASVVPAGDPFPDDRHPDWYDVAVLLLRDRFDHGEPIPAYFVLKNRREETLALDMWLDFSGPVPYIWNSCTFDVRSRATGKSVLREATHISSCGGGSFADVSGGGYFVVKGDLSRVSGEPLPPGEYEVVWGYASRRTAPARFTVTPTNPPAKPVAKPAETATHFLQLSPDGRAAERAVGVGDKVEWNVSVANLRTRVMTAALAVGVGGKYIPDPRTIPASDGRVEVTAVWKWGAGGDRVTVTVRSAVPGREVTLAEIPHFFLQVERERPDGLEEEAERAVENLKESSDTSELRTPLAVEMRLPKGWRKNAEVNGKCRIAVLVSSTAIEFPTGGRRIEKLKQHVMVARRPSDTEPSIPWSGVLRTTFTEMRAAR